jgi:MoxR-like ATPase
MATPEQEATIQKLLDALDAAGGTLVFEEGNPEHEELIASINLTIRSEIARAHGVVIHYEASRRRPDKIYRNKTSSASMAASGKKTSKPAPKPTPKPKPKRVAQVSHEFIPPPFLDEVVALLGSGRDWEHQKSTNLMFVGPKGSGKTETIEILRERCGFEKVFQVNGFKELSAAEFLGDKTVVIDEASMQSYLSYQQGVIELAMVHGTELDANGHQVLEDGKVKVTGPPAMLFIDEYAGLDPSVAFVLNRALQIPRAPGQSRMIELSSDSNRPVLSHPGFCTILAGNVIGRGHASEEEEGYEAQTEAQDISFLDRICATFYFGYNLDAERQVVMSKIADDGLVAKVLQFRDAVRKAYCNRTAETLLSTRGLIALCDNIRVLTEAGFKDAATRAIYRTVYSCLVETEKKAWREAIRLVFGVDVVSEYEKTAKLWVPDFKGI